VPRALLSVTDKTGIVDLARGLADRGYELVSTGGTARTLREAGLEVRDVADVTGFPEMLDGRVKTLHPKIHGGLLGDVRHAPHREAMVSADIVPIDLLVVNLYAFEKTVTNEHRFEDAIESVDIGGPAMIRAAAKNGENVAVVVDPTDYASVLDGPLDRPMRLRLMAKAFRHTAFYDSMVARYLSRVAGESETTETLTLGWRRVASLRYGENPHQQAALYADPLGAPGIARARQRWGKELSYNNLLDAEAAWGLVCDLPPGAVAIIKHGNPCGVALGASLGESYRLARASDPISAFGGIAAFHGPVDIEAARAMTEPGNFLEVAIGLSIGDDALAVFQERAAWAANARLLEADAPQPDLSLRTISGGVLVQTPDTDPEMEWQTVTERAPTPDELEALRFNWRIAKHVKSNAIVVGVAGRMLGVGAGQMNRVQSVRLALEMAGEAARGAVLASDAFFPFPDSVETAAAAGIAAIAQPGGSKKDPDVIAAANRFGLAMVLTGARHFRH